MINDNCYYIVKWIFYYNNNTYGGYGFSDKAIREYNEIKLAADPNYIVTQGHHIYRSDPVMLEIVKRLGREADGRYAMIKIKQIPLVYKDFYTISEYDGEEEVLIHYNAYKVSTITNIINSDHPDKLFIKKYYKNN